MLTAQWLYSICACLILALGLRATLLQTSFLRRIIAINIMGTGVFMMLVIIAYRGPGAAPDPIPHALVLTGIVVAVSATALALALIRRLNTEKADE